MGAFLNRLHATKKTGREKFKKGDIFVLPGFQAFGVAINKHEAILVESGLEKGVPQTTRGRIPAEAELHTIKDTVMVSFYTIAAVNAARMAIAGKPWF